MFAGEEACPPLAAPENGKVEVSGQTRGSNATYSCNIGFELSGPETVQCTDEFLWSSDPPTCIGEVLMHLLLYSHNALVHVPLEKYGKEFYKEETS